MSDLIKPAIGSIGWVDLTVDNADTVRDFYREVTGWSPAEVDMGSYSDYCMNTAAGTSVAGVCHARGTNSGLPAQWLIYITVEDLDRRAERCVELGGQVLVSPKSLGGQGRYCVIQDPAGAVAALYEPAEP